MSDTLIFKLHKVILSQGCNKICLFLPLEVVENDSFLRPLALADVELTLCGRFDFVPCDSDPSLNKPVE